LLWPGPGSAKNSGQTAEPAALRHDLSLSVRVDVESSRLHVRYTVRSREARVTYLLNRLHRNTPDSIDPNLCYIDFEPRTRTVIVSKRIADLPSDRTVYQPVAPYVSRLSPGGEFAERVALVLPIRARHEYDGADRPPVQEEKYTSLRLRLGYFVVPDGTSERFEPSAAGRILIPTLPPGTRPEFGELTAEQRGLSLPVLAPVRAR
jgi:hypothetical protein